MHSNHMVALNRITWGMSAVALVTAAGLALTASSSGVVPDLVSVPSHFDSAKPVFLPQAPDAEAVEAWDVPEAPSPPTAFVPPFAPAPLSQPSAASAGSTSSYHDVDVPTQAEMAAMVPDVQVEHRCDGGQDVVTQREFTGATGKRHVRIAICNSAAQRTAMIEARAGLAEAHRVMTSARMASAQARADAQADLAEARAEMAEAQADMRRERAQDARDDY